MFLFLICSSPVCEHVWCPCGWVSVPPIPTQRGAPSSRTNTWWFRLVFPRDHIMALASSLIHHGGAAANAICHILSNARDHAWKARQSTGYRMRTLGCDRGGGGGP